MIPIATIWGVLVSIVQQVTSIFQRTRKLKVRLSSSFVPPPLKEALIIQVVNTGSRNVTIDKPQFRLPDENVLAFPWAQSDASFPCELSDGKRCTVLFSRKAITQKLRSEGYAGTIKLIGFCSDTIGKNYESKPLKCNLNS